LQKISKFDRHGPSSHINRVLVVKTTDEVAHQIVQISIKDRGNPRPFFVVAKNLTVANDGDNLAGVRIDDIAKEHVSSRRLPMRRLQLRTRRVVPVAVSSSADQS
jgi:hypothetical protein